MAKSKNYIPATDAGMNAFASNFSSQIAGNPQLWGLTQSIADNYAGKQTAYATALQIATDPSTRGKSSIFAKNTAKKDLIAYTRLLVKTIQGTTSVTAQMKLDIGINPGDHTRTPAPVPTAAPILELAGVAGLDISFVLRNRADGRRNKPKGVKGASLFYFIGDVPPADPTAWTFAANTTKSKDVFSAPTSITSASNVWLSAMWFNSRAESGPACAPVCAAVSSGAAKIAA